MGYFHLTTPQQNIWNLQKYYSGTAIANLCGAVFFQERRDSKLLCQAVREFIRSQSGIRLRFDEGEEPRQYISDEVDEDIPVRVFRSREEFDVFAKGFAREPIGLSDQRMYRFVVFHLEQENRSGILPALSHLIADAWTFGLMANQLDAAYRSLAGEEDVTLLEGDYADFIRSEDAYLASERYGKDERYWEGKYPVRPEESPVKLRTTSVDSVEAGRITRTLPFSLEQGIEAYCKSRPVTEAVLFETALVIYLSRINPEVKTVTVGVPVLNRGNAREKEIAGMFVSTMPLTVNVTENTEISELTRQITKGHMDLFRHQKYPYADILRQLREKQDFSGNLYDAMISYQNAKTKTVADTKWYSNGYSEVPLAIHIDNRDGKECHTINVDFQTAVFRDETEIELLIDRLEYILGQIVAVGVEKVGEIGIVPPKEYGRIVYDFNDTYVEYPREKCIHELFTEQAAKTPEQMALVFEDQQFSYRQLDEMSNSLAHFLREKGIQPGDVVPIIAKRSWHVIVAMLGVLKAGGAYMPIDPNYPDDRIGYMLSETQPKLALVYRCTNNGTYEVIDLAKVDYGKHIGRIENRNSSDDMCYVLYTSGSMGKPKAVCVSHANMGNFNNNNNHYQHAMLGICSTVLADTEFVFDISAFEIFLSLLNGLCLILTKEIMDAQYLAGLIDKHHVDALHITPTKLLTLLHDREFQKAAAQIKVLMVGAEVFTENLYQTVSRYTDATIYNGYGPTETTIGCCFKKVNRKRSKCIHELFMEQAAKTPEQVALVFEDQQFTYRQLDEMSNSLAHFLREKGIHPRDVVPIIAKRSWHVIVAMLGVLKAGGAYMLVDYQYPVDRISYLVQECKANIILVYGCKYTNAVDLKNIDYSKGIDPIESINEMDDNLCVIHTSGSTGIPKVAALSHKNMTHCIDYSEKFFYGVNQTISTTTITFDAFILETVVPLCRQVQVILLSEAQINQNEFEKVVSKYKDSFLFQTPTKLQSYIKNSKTKEFLSRITSFVIGGEVFPQELYDTIRMYNPDGRIYNGYGPTETTLCVVANELREGTDITIGTPIANTQIYILDSNQRPVPIGVSGELCIAGEGVGKGYLNRPELTAERFVPNPFATEENHHGKTMYRTGDLARFRSDGEIEYLGRMDTQVKIRGLRIELGEIESVMGNFPGIGLCAVVDKRDETGRQYLVGYYTVAAETCSGADNKTGDRQSGKKSDTETEIMIGIEQGTGLAHELDEKVLRAHLSAKLPKYMVPNYFMRLETMPMTDSGKTDRKNLPAPDFTQQATEYEPPQTDMEKRLAEIWQELLHVKKVGRTDDFFELGGDSLLAITMLSEIEKNFHVEFSVRDVMEHSELAALAQCLEAVCGADNADMMGSGETDSGLADGDGIAGGLANSHVRGCNVAGHMTAECRGIRRITAHHANQFPLLPQQKAVYAACMKEPDTLVYNMPAKIILPDTVDRDRLKESIAQVIDQHKMLKSSIRMGETGLLGFYEGNARIVFEEYETGKEDTFVRSFDIGKAPLVRVGFTEDALLFDMHHIIADGASMNFLLRDIAAVYEGKGLSEQEAEYPDYAEYFYYLDMEEHKAYFRKMLKCDWEPIILPETKKPGTGGESRPYKISEEVFAGAKKYARENGLTDTMVFLGAYGILLSKYTGRKEILSSIVLQNRSHADTRGMMGMFVNTLPVCLALESGTGMKGSVAEYMQDVKEKMLGLFRYQELPFEDISEAVGMTDRSVVNTSFVYQGDGEKVLLLEGQKLTPQFMDTHTAKFDLSMEITPMGSGCMLRLEYNLAKYDGQLMDALAKGYIRILEQLGKEKLADISVLSSEECHRIVEGFNDTYVEYPNEKCVHELFMEQAAKTPERTALVFEDQEFTYRQLDEMSNSMAHFLREKGIQSSDIVPIIAKRSWHVVVAMLGVLKAGGAYMLVDYQYPADRISYLVKECGADIVLVYSCKRANAVDLESIDYSKDIYPIESINKMGDVLCVIHTSGSTGVPKVTALSHENTAHYIDYSEKLFRGTRHTIATTTITFDAFIQETLVSLCRQVPVILLSERQITNQSEFEKIVGKYKDSFLFQTPTKLQSYIRNSKTKEFLSHIASFVIGGELFPQELYDAIRTYNPDGRIYNIYGPTETTVCAVVNELREGADITIGTPIANTQIYILDSDQCPVPIGVPGELCIAGEGVGKGYLNRPELTAERFIPNPYATKENHHGKVMYRTGDLARFRSDGEIEYLGRMDTQVKIRGLRIELGEIESVMGSFPGIGLCAVTDKRDETGRQYLVGYYTVVEATCGGVESSKADGGKIAGGQGIGKSDIVSGAGQGTDFRLDEKTLRAHLSAKLPKYMVPNYFMRLETMPMTASGKTDRKNLPVPDLAQSVREYIAPATEKEEKLCHLMEELLHIEQVGVTDDFFELGGDSLTAIEFLAKAHDNGIVFALQNIFDYPTVRQLCDHMEAKDEEKIHYNVADFDKYQELLAENMIDETFVPERKSLGNVLLTGATGFLGAHVLERLFQEETGKIYCLVRDEEKVGGRERLRETLRYYFGERYEAELAQRIIPIAGDIELEALAENMPEDVQTVIHTAASVKHYGSNEYFNRVNVEGTRHVVNYAKSVGARLIHISTLSVSGNSLADEFAVYRSDEEKYFAETSLYIGQPLDNVYIHSKFEAERAVFDAMLGGLDAKIIRVGNLTSRAADYKFQPNYRQNAFLTRVKAILEFGLFPDYLIPLYAEFSPIDLTAEGVVKIAQYADRQTVFHLNSNRPIYFDRFLEVVHELGISMKAVDGNTFTQALRKTIRDRVTEYIFEAFQNDMDEQGRLVYDSNIHIENDFTVWFLKKLGFEWNEIDLEYIKGYVEYFRRIGYLEV